MSLIVTKYIRDHCCTELAEVSVAKKLSEAANNLFLCIFN